MLLQNSGCASRIRDALRALWMRFAHSGCASRILDAPVAFDTGSLRFAPTELAFARVDIQSEISCPVRLEGGGGGPDPSACNPKFSKNYNDLL